MLKLAGVKAHHCVFVDESGINPPDTLRRKGWAKAGITPVLKAKFQRENRVQILSAYTLKGIKLSRVFTGSTDKALFEDFIEQLLRHCGTWPEPESAIIMDNAAFHLSDKIEHMCEAAGVRLFMTAPYTPRTNPIEEHFGVFKIVARSRAGKHQDLRRRSFEDYLKACIEALRYRSDIAEGHFRNAGFYIEPAH
jgi:transposase